MKVVIDTNVLMSGIFFEGKPHQILVAFDNNRCKLYASEDIVTEYEEVYERLKQKLKRVPKDYRFQDFINRLKLVEIESSVRICRDPDDDKFISCALDAKALCIISGDKDLLSIEEYKGILIMSATEFCECFL